jgi:hypothetical protein
MATNTFVTGIIAEAKGKSNTVLQNPTRIFGPELWVLHKGLAIDEWSE